MLLGLFFVVHIPRIAQFWGFGIVMKMLYLFKLNSTTVSMAERKKAHIHTCGHVTTRNSIFGSRTAQTGVSEIMTQSFLLFQYSTGDNNKLKRERERKATK